MSADNQPSRGQELLRLLREQRDIFGQLDKLARQQQSLIIGDDPEPLLNLLAERQRLVDRLVRLNQQATAYRQRWAQDAPAVSDEDRQQADTLLADINEMLADILAVDQRDCELLASRKNAVADELEDTHVGQRATQAYQNRAAEPSVLDTTDTSA